MLGRTNTTIGLAGLGDNVTVTQGSNGTITLASGNPDDPTFASNVTYSITANAGYVTQNVLIDGDALGPIGTYTFVRPGPNHSISATFGTPTAAVGTYTGTNTPTTYTPVPVTNQSHVEGGLSYDPTQWSDASQTAVNTAMSTYDAQNANKVSSINQNLQQQLADLAASYQANQATLLANYQAQQGTVNSYSQTPAQDNQTLTDQYNSQMAALTTQYNQTVESLNSQGQQMLSDLGTSRQEYVDSLAQSVSTSGQQAYAQKVGMYTGAGATTTPSAGSTTTATTTPSTTDTSSSGLSGYFDIFEEDLNSPFSKMELFIGIGCLCLAGFINRQKR